jgi:hypothetical protein
VLKRKTAWRDGTTQLVMSPLEFMQQLAALVPRRRQPAPEPFATSPRRRQLRGDQFRAVNFAEGSGVPVRLIELRTHGLHRMSTSAADTHERLLPGV